MGPVEVPAERLWGAQTERSRHFFAIGVPRFVWTRPVIRGLGLLKKAAALANGELGTISPERAELIARAADEVIGGALDAEFPLVVFQTGSGTQSNMNANEVIANRANQLAGKPLGSHEPVHPNDHVNKGQSSNDGFPVVMHVVAVEGIVHRLIPEVTLLRDTLESKARAYADVVMIGRTHLQDAVPITLGQVIGGWVAQIDGALAGVRASLDPLYELAFGATAVGTGLNAHPRFSETASQAHGRRNRPAIPRDQQPCRGAVGARRDGGRKRRHPDAGRRVDEDGQRRALVCVGTARRHRRAAHSRK